MLFLIEGVKISGFEWVDT